MCVCELGIFKLGIEPTDLSCVRVCELGIDPTDLSCVRVCRLGVCVCVSVN